jgi:hypothetical protein
MTTTKEALYGGAAYTGDTRTTKEVLYGDEGYSFTPAEESAWYDVMTKFESAARDFDAAVRGLQARASVAARDPSLREEHAALMARAQSMESKLRYLRQAVDDVRAALLGAWNSVTGVWSDVMNRVGLHGMDWTLQGLPLIPIAAVIAATSLLAAFVSDYAKFAKRADMYESLVAQGRSPSDAAAIVERLNPSTSLVSVASSPIVWLIAAGLAFWLWRTK